ncbi:MAG TPA: calcium-binding protein, partial [Alphaproteobacteria bacterium]|nr:calcium-binding protein [Alphaproteobacteria bacterium]
MQRVNGDDLSILVAGAGSILITDQFYSSGGYKVECVEFQPGSGSPIDLTVLGQTISGTDNAETLTGLDRAYFKEDILSGMGGDDILRGGLGDDLLYGGYGNDTYVYGGGVDLIRDDGGAGDKIVFGSGFNPALFTFTLSNPAYPQESRIFYDGVLVAKIEGQFNAGRSLETLEITGGPTITLANVSYIQEGSATGDSLSGLEYGGSPNNILNGLAGNDWLYAYAGNDTLNGGQGDDYLDGSSGDDIYIYNPGDGWDRVLEYGGVDVIRFGSGISSSAVSLDRPNDWDLRILINGAPALDVQNFFYTYGTDYRIERLEFADGSSINMSGYQNVIGTEGDDTLSGLDRSLLKSDYLAGNGGNDTLTGGAGNDRMEGGNGNDTLTGGSGDDRIKGDSGDDILRGHTGNDTLQGGYGLDTYAYNSGDGLDTISDQGGPAQTDTISFGSGLSSMDMRLVRVGNTDMAIEFGGDRKILVQNQFTDNGAIETVRFSDGTLVDLLTWSHRTNGTANSDALYGTNAGAGADKLYGYGGDDTIRAYAGDDFLIGGTGNDQLYGGYGDDRYVYESGVDTVMDDGGNDRIDLGAGIAAANLSWVREGTSGLNLLIDGALAVRMDGQFSHSDSGIERVRFSDGTYFYLSSLQFTTNGTSGNDALQGISYGANPNDILNGLGGNDTIYGGLGNDTIDGGDGADQLFGDKGDDTYRIQSGQGADDITDAEGTDKIVFGTGFASSALTMTRAGMDLVLAFGGTMAATIRSHFYYNAPYALERLEFSDGSAVNI